MARSTTARRSKKTAKKKKAANRSRKKLPKRKKKKATKKTKKKTTKKRKAATRRKTKKKKTKKKAKKPATKKRTTKKRTTKKRKATKRKTKKKAAKKSRTKTKVGRSKSSGNKVVKLEKARTTSTNQLSVGDKAPDFTVNDQNGQSISLSQFEGKKVVLYFYPKDDTPGCTREACSFRDHLSEFQGLDAEILGVSFDDQASHQKFIDKYGLNFKLLADTEKEIASKYGVYVQKNMYGKTYWGIERSTFVIDRSGHIAAIFRNVRVDGHTEEVMNAVKQIN